MAKRNRKRGSTRQQRELMKKKRRKKRAALLLIELFILAILGVVAYGVFKFKKLDFNILDDKKLAVYKDTGPYTNIALFGLDSREGEIEGGVQSDTIMIASINNKTDEVKIVSVYRDTLLQQEDGSYEKANSAYNFGGPEDAIALLNRNFDLDIKKYMSVNFNALIDVIDAVGGIEVDVTEEEVNLITGYATEIIRVTGIDSMGVFEPGLQTLNGVQATAYARIRQTDGNDIRRTERQRFVIEQIVKKAQSSNVVTLNKIIDKVLPQVSTNFKATELMGVAANAMNYKIGDTTGFPFDITYSDNVVDHVGSYVIPDGLADNVKQLHKYLFNDKEYSPSAKVQEVDEDIIYLTSGGSDYTEDQFNNSDTDSAPAQNYDTNYDAENNTNNESQYDTNNETQYDTDYGSESYSSE